MSFADYGEDTYLDALFTVFGATLYVALSTADPTDDGSGLAEPSGNGYARASTTSSDWAASSGGTKATDTAISFSAATGNWGTITHFALMDALTGGNMIASGALGTSESISTDQVARFASGDLSISLG